MNTRLSLSFALITLFVGCEAQLVCEVCTGDHSTQSHIDRATAEDGGVPDADAMFSDDVLLAFVARHRDDGFIRVNAEPYSSEVSEAKLNVFVSEFALPEYLETAPDETESDGMIPRGSFVVRELVDSHGDVSKLTALYRGPKGYNPRSGDFWFAVTDPDGRVLPDSTGAPMAGALPSCSGCHAGRASADYLFGVPANARFSEFGHPTMQTEQEEESEPAQTPEQDPASEQEPGSEPDPTSEPNPTTEPQPEPQAEVVDLTGWILANVEADLSREQKATFAPLEAPVGSNVVIGRDASRADFEAVWGPLPASAIYVNQNQSSSFGAPIVNGGESWELRDATGAVVDGATPVGESESTYERGAADGNWTARSLDEATPGAVSIALPAGVWITEWSDASDYQVEFVEIAVR